VGNLAHNAIKYIRDGAGRRITLRVLARKNMVRVEVEDNGPGLPPELEKVVFNPFVRGQGSGASGFGLGLATVKKAAEAHGGKVGVRSVPGQGCLFWFELPTFEPSAARQGA
jgi:signal transduction histidine kinase